MLIKQFRHVHVRVPDPLRPGRFAREERLHPTGATELSHGGETITSDKRGWFEVSHETGLQLLSFVHPNGERFHTPDEVDESVALGAASADDLPDHEKKAEKKADDKKDEKKDAKKGD